MLGCIIPRAHPKPPPSLRGDREIYLLEASAPDISICTGGLRSALNTYSSAANQGGAVGWHHWVFGQTAAGFNPFVYRDGASVTMADNGSGTGGFGSSSINLTIGISPFETYYPQQFLDEVALWSTNAGSVIPTAAQLNALTYRRFIV